MKIQNIIAGFCAFIVMVIVVGTIIGVSAARQYTGCDTLGNYKPMNGSRQVSNNRR